MNQVTIVIPNYNGKTVLKDCLDSLLRQTWQDFEIILVDNGSDDGSVELAEQYAGRLFITTICNPENQGFAKAVNDGIRTATTEYVLLLNNDTIAGHHMVEELVHVMRGQPKVFSAQALMLQMQDRRRVDNAGDYLNILGWARTRRKGQSARHIRSTEQEIFSACAGAAIYRRSMVMSLGGFDETYFAYLEDVDLGYRARLQGYRNLLVPRAKVLHVGSATTGSQHNAFKVRLAAKNTLLTLYKNMPGWQLLLNAFPILTGCVVKWCYFFTKKLGKAYAQGVWDALQKIPTTKKTDLENVALERIMEVQKGLFSNIFQ